MEFFLWKTTKNLMFISDKTTAKIAKYNEIQWEHLKFDVPVTHYEITTEYKPSWEACNGLFREAIPVDNWIAFLRNEEYVDNDQQYHWDNWSGDYYFL